MKKFPKPWFRPKRGVWFVTLGGKQHNLGPDRDAAFQAYHEIMGQPKKRAAPTGSVVALIDLFLEHVQKNQARETYLWYQSRLEKFARRYPDLLVSQLKKFHVQQWIDSYEVAGGTKRNYARSILRCMKWCEEEELIDKSPLCHFKKPAGGKREKVISQDEYELILSLVRNDSFRDLLIVTWDTGCRPQESLIVEARHVDLRNCRWRFPESESKGKKHERVVYLTDIAMEITQRLMLKHPEGPLFRNSEGLPWTTDAVNCAFIALQTRLGKRKQEIPKEKRRRVPAADKANHEKAVAERRKKRNAEARGLGEKYCLYHFRHSWMNRLLTAGVDSLTVAILAGHVDTSTLAKTYQHLSQNPKFLLDQAKRAG